MLEYEVVQTFSDTEMVIFKYILKNKKSIEFMSIRDLADQVHASTASVIRFCQKCGFDKFSEFKNAFLEYVSDINLKSPEKDLQELLLYFQGVNTDVFEKKLEEGVRFIRKAEKVIFIGMGTSGMIGKYGARYFSNFGKFSLSIEDPYYPVFQDLSDDTVIIALSVSGESNLIIEMLTKFRHHKCKLLSITNEPNSTIARVSDWNICYNTTKSKIEPIYDVTSQVPVVFLIEALARRI